MWFRVESGAMTLAAGARLGPYEIVSAIGAGGMGEVYRARDPRLRVHLYGKDLRPGRKVGHVNAYGDDLDDCLERARHAAAWFRGDLGNESE
jgi:phosphoribosylaminoimidazole carboxylase (NCAIR synthetase)